MLGIRIAASTVREILRQAGIDPAPERTSTARADFLCSQAGACLPATSPRPSRWPARACTCWRSSSTPPGGSGSSARPLIPPHPWVAQAAKNFVMDLQDAGSRARFLIRDRDGKFPGLFNAVLSDAGIKVVLSGVQMPRMNPVTERWVQTCRNELLDRTLIWNQHHLLYALRESGRFCNEHRPHRTLRAAAPLRPLPGPITDPERIAHLDVRRRDRLGGTNHEYRHAA